MKAYLEYRPSEFLHNNHLIATGEKLPATKVVVDRYTTVVNFHAIEVEMTELSAVQRAVLVTAGEVKFECFVGKLRGKPSISTTSGIPNIWFDVAKQRLFYTVPTVVDWLGEVRNEQDAANELLPDLRAAQAKWFAGKNADLKSRIESATSATTSLWPIDAIELKDLQWAGINTNEYEAMLVEWESTIQPALKEQDAEIKRRSDEYNEQKRIAAEAAKAQAEADKLAWCAAHGTPHLAQAVATGYDCTRLYATERAALEHPAYTLDYKNNGEWKDRSCPGKAALAEALAVGGEVVWMTEPPRYDSNNAQDEWFDFEPREAVVIRGFLGKYDLVRTF